MVFEKNIKKPCDLSTKKKKLKRKENSETKPLIKLRYVVCIQIDVTYLRSRVPMTIYRRTYDRLPRYGYVC